MYIIFVFVAAFALFNKFYNILLHPLEMAISLNNLNNIRNISIIVFDKIIVLSNIIPYSFDGDL